MTKIRSATRLLAAALLIVSVGWAAPADAARIASLVRGVGAGSDKAAGFVSHELRRALEEDERYEVIGVADVLGSPTRKRAKRAFGVAEEMVQKGRSAYETLELDPAIEYLNTALTKYERHAGHVTDIKKVSTLLMLLGATHILRGEEKTGAKRLAQAVAIDPEVEPDPSIFNPGMRSIFNDARDRLQGRARGTLSVTSNPSYAEVYLDGKFVGVTPLAVDEVSEGRHFVRMVKDGYRARGSVVDVVGQVEAAELGTLKQTDSFEEFEALVEAATPSLPNKKAGDRVGEVFKQLGVVLEVEQLMMAEVRLDGERVRVLAVQIDLADGSVVKSASQTFSYDSRPKTYAREVDDLLRRNFSDETLTSSSDGTTASDGGLVHAASGICFGMPCSKFKTLLLAAGGGGGALLGLLGGLLDYLAYVDNSNYRDGQYAQVSPQADDLASAGKTKAVVGDILVGVGLAVAVTSVVLYFVWDPSPATGDVIDQSSPGWSLGFVPLPDGAALSAQVEF